MHTDIFLLWEHCTFTCFVNITNNITLVFCTIDVTIKFSQNRQASAANSSPDLHTYWPEYIKHDLSHCVCAKHDYGVDCYDFEIQTIVYAFCSQRRAISLCMISRYEFTLKVLEHSLNVKEYLFLNGQEIHLS